MYSSFPLSDGSFFVRSRRQSDPSLPVLRGFASAASINKKRNYYSSGVFRAHSPQAGKQRLRRGWDESTHTQEVQNGLQKEKERKNCEAMGPCEKDESCEKNARKAREKAHTGRSWEAVQRELVPVRGKECKLRIAANGSGRDIQFPILLEQRLAGLWLTAAAHLSESRWELG